LSGEEAEIGTGINAREHDVLLSTGEQITVSKLVMCLNTLGYEAVSYLGWQIPIVTDETHGNAEIKHITTDKIIRELKSKKIVVVAGFQGISENGDITTLGRGGSDTTAVALAAYLKADKCEIFTDVDGIYTADPNESEEAVKLYKIGYNEMLQLVDTGAQVLHRKSIEIAKEHGLPIVVRSTFEPNSMGTIVGD